MIKPGQDIRNRCHAVALAVALLGGPVHAAPVKVVDLDFARAEAGCVPDRSNPGAVPVSIPTFTVYGRLRGESALPQPGTRYATAALGRTGELDALRLGDAGEGLGPVGYRFTSGKPFALEFWMYVYDVRKYFWGSLLVIPQGPVHGSGFSLTYQKSKWSPEGWMEWRWGKGAGSDAFWHKGIAPDRWHQIVISQDVTTLSLFVDGELSDRRQAVISFEKSGGELFLGRRGSVPKAVGLDFKLDDLTIYDAALSPDEVKARYAAGLPPRSFTAEDEAKLQELKLEIPSETYGYFRAGEAIPVLIDGHSEADELRANGKSHSLPLKTPATVLFAKPGFQKIELALLAKGAVLKQVTYPVAIAPFANRSSKLGAAEMATRQPEVRGLGINLGRVEVNWAELEPKKQDYDWTRLDAVMKRNQEMGAETILCLTGIPSWEKRADGSPNLPADMTRFKRIWRLLANRYDGVRYFEVWSATNPNGSLTGNPEQKLQDYGILLQSAAEVLRSESPEAKILAGRIDTGDGRATAAYLQKHAADSFDIFSARKDSIDPVARYVKNPWSAEILKATTKPVWNTASGVGQFARPTLLPVPTSANAKAGVSSTVDEMTGAAWQIQDIALQLADGISRIILDPGPSEYEPASTSTTGLPGVKGLALAVFNSLVGENATLEKVSEAPLGVFAFRFDNPQGQRGLILFTDGKARTVVMEGKNPEARGLDLLGSPLPIESGTVEVTAQPIYLINTERITTLKPSPPSDIEANPL